MNQGLFSYGTYEIDIFAEIIDTFMNLNYRATVSEGKLCNMTLHYDMGQVQNHTYNVNIIGQTKLYLMNMSEQHPGIYEAVIHKLEQSLEVLDILSTEHLPITLLSSTQLTHMLEEVKATLQKTNQDLSLLFYDVYCYYDMKLISSGYNKDFNPLFNFTFSLNHKPQSLWLYISRETVPVSIKENNIEENSYTLLQPRKKITFP